MAVAIGAYTRKEGRMRSLGTRSLRRLAAASALLLLSLATPGRASQAAVAAGSTGTWALTGSMQTARTDHTATLLPDGKVLVVAGYADGGFVPLASAELYDPASGTWAVTGSLQSARAYHTATLLQDGKVLVAEGCCDQPFGGALGSAELYDPTSGTWAPAGNLHANRTGHTATLLQDGTVLVAGGFAGNWLASAELFTEVPCTGRAEETAGRGVVAFGKGWRHLADARASGDGVQASDRPGAEASFRFPGRGTRLLATTGPEMGRLDISVDGRDWGTADLYSPTLKHQQVVAFVHGLADGWHTVTYRVSAKKNPQSSGYWCPLDRFDHHTTE
jgi:hypothetical protein